MWSIKVRPVAVSFATRAAGVLAACAALSACATSPASKPTVADAKTPLDQYAISVERAPAQVALSIHAAGLSPTQQAALADFVGRWRGTGASSPITLETPVGAAQDADPRLAGKGVAQALSALGVPSQALRLADYDAAATPHAPLLVRYDAYVAKGPDCRSHWDNLVSTNSNNVASHFGCADAANLAAMVADAHDLVRPAQSGPADAMRRAKVMDSYRAGQVSSAARDAQASGSVSTAVQ